MRWAATALLSCLPILAQTSSIEGVTVDTTTGEPLAGVHVRLLLGAQQGTLAYGALSDREGKFSIAIIRPGTYMLEAERAGYFFTPPPEKGKPHITIRTGQKLTGFRMEMTRRAILSGKVVDELGDPVENTRVEMIPADPDAPPARSAGLPYTNDRGEFRIVTSPGRYYLRAAVDPSPRGRGEIGENGAFLAPYAATFYPSSVSREDATPVEAVAGKEIPNLEIRMVRHKGVSVSGIIRERPMDTAVVINLVRETDSQTGSFANMGSFEGTFEFPNMDPGRYAIQAFTIGKPLYSERLAFQVNSSDVTNLELHLKPGSEIEGTLQVEGGPLASLGGRPAIQLAPLERWFNTPRTGAGDLDPQGAFHFDSVRAAKYRIELLRFPDTAYLKKVEVEDAAVPDRILDLEPGPRSARIQLTVSLHGAILGGRVLDEDGEPLPAETATVILAPEGAKDPLPAESFAAIEEGGRYSFRNVRPGKYRIAAITRLRLAPPSMAPYADRAEPIEIREDAHLSKDLHILSKRASRAAPQQ